MRHSSMRDFVKNSVDMEDCKAEMTPNAKQIVTLSQRLRCAKMGTHCVELLFRMTAGHWVSNYRRQQARHSVCLSLHTLVPG